MMLGMAEAWVNRIVGQGEEDPEQLAANPRNWRVHPKVQQEALTGVLDKVGWVDSVIVNRQTGFVVDGHLRVSLALRRHEKTIPVQYIDVTEEEEMLVLATLDPLAALAVSDTDKLGELLGSLSEDDERLSRLIHGVQDDVVSEPPDVSNRAGELQAKWNTELGQIWEAGNHRIVCGDCTDKAVVDRVMEGEKADAVVTDPPYGVGVDYGSFEDTPENVKELINKFMPFVFDNLPAAIVCGVASMWEYPRPTWVGTWVHPAAMNPGPWGFNGNNPILYYGKDPYLRNRKGSRLDSIVMASDREGIDGHPTPKPFAVWEWLVERMTSESGATVLDLFLGSGTTLIACEHLGRNGRGVEIDPGYVAVALERLSSLGLEPKLVSG